MSEFQDKATAEVISGGPLLLQGAIRLPSAAGEESWEGSKAALCRCGLSDKKPFCDGSHRGGFQDEPKVSRLRASDGEPGTTVELKALQNGPVIVQGPLTLECEGESLVCDRFSLCRCGQSREMPRCDGSHKTCGFKT